MYQLLTYLSCCFLLVAGITVEPDHHSSEEAMTESSFEFPEDVTLHELNEPTSEEDHLMEAHKINWMPMAQGQDPHNLREGREVLNVLQILTNSAVDKKVVHEEEKEEEEDEHVQHEEHQEEDEEDHIQHSHHDKEEEDDEEEQVDVEPEEEEQVRNAPQEEEEAPIVDQLVPRDGSACPSNAESGLTRLILNARPLLPTDRIRNILANAKEDAEVRELIKLLRSDEFKERVSRLRATKEQGVLRDYVCQGLKLNHAYFIDYVKVFLNVQTTETASNSLPKRRKGVRGLLQDLRDALPRAQLRDLYRRQLATDKELNTAVRRIRSSEFRRLLSNVRALPEYRAVRNDLEKAGVPMQQILNLVSNALGWGTLDMGSETIIAGI